MSWWISTGFLRQGGRKVLGPFESEDLALRVREYVEKAEGHMSYFVDEEIVKTSGDQFADALRHLARRGQSSSKEIAEQVGWGSRTAGPRMVKLEQQGLVKRVIVKHGTFRSDNKYEWVLTDKGRELVAV